MSSGTKRKADLKVVILGDVNVGKTSLICRYIDGKFLASDPTVGASFFMTHWGPYNVAVWDTAGQEKYTGLSSFYCRNAGAAIFAFDLNCMKSFNSLGVRFLPLLDSAHECCLKVLVGTKLDLTTPGSRQVSTEAAEKLALQMNADQSIEKLQKAPYFETSSKTGQNVEEVFDYILQYCLPLSPEQIKRRPTVSKSTINLTDIKSESSTEEDHKKCCA